MKIRTTNDFLFGASARNMAPMLPVHITTREQAFRTAAWIILMGETLRSENPDEPPVEFEDVKKAIEST